MVEAAGFSFRLDPKSVPSVALLTNSGFKELQLTVQRWALHWARDLDFPLILVARCLLPVAKLIKLKHVPGFLLVVDT